MLSAFFAPAAVSVAAEAHPPTSVVVFIDYSGSIQGPARAGYRREPKENGDGKPPDRVSRSPTGPIVR